ncbi:MAG: PQQ-binding-like beta-propeller repeat protein [Gammaproteobacteria bacterium]
MTERPGACRWPAPVLLWLSLVTVTAGEAGEAPPLVDFTATGSDYLVQFLVPGSDFLSIHGLTFDRDDRLLVGSVMGQAIYAVDTRSGEASEEVGPPQGCADDLEFGPDGSLVWTSILTGEVFVRRPDGSIDVLADNLPGANSVAFRDDGRLFVTQVLWGDALWELDPSGRKPPRRVASDLGGLNGFDFDAAGHLYGPLIYQGVVVRVDVETGAVSTVASGFGLPVAVNFDSQGRLYVADSKLGRIVRMDVASGEQTLVATVDSAIDNLAFDSHDRLYITNMVDNAVHEVNTRTGATRTVTQSRLSVPGGLDVVTIDGVDQVYLGDLFAFRRIDGNSGEVHTVRRGIRDPMAWPMAVNARGDLIVTASWFTDAVEVYDRARNESRAVYHGLADPVDAVLLADGDVLVAEQGKGRLLRISHAEPDVRSVVAEDLGGLAAMRPANDGAVYVTDVLAGELLRIDLANGARQVVASGLDHPEGFDVAPNGSVVLAEVGRQRVVRIDPTSGRVEEIARNLALGYPAAKGTPPAYIQTGVAVGAGGDIYVSSDRTTALYKISAQ